MGDLRSRRRRVLPALLLGMALAIGTAACEGDGELPTLDPADSGAPLFDQGVDPAETQPELDD